MPNDLERYDLTSEEENVITTGAAKELARELARERSRQIPMFVSACVEGSITRMKDEDVFPATSDVHLEFVIDREERDPFSELEGEFQTVLVSNKSIVIAASYRSMYWLDRITGTEPLPPGFASGSDLRSMWCCVADLGGITNRKVYLASRKALEAHGMDDLYGRVLRTFGCDRVDEAQATEHLRELERAFDAAVGCVRTHFRGAFWFKAPMRALVVDAAWQLAREGYPREGMGFMLALRGFAQNAIENDAPDREKARFRAGFQRLRSTLGFDGSDALGRKVEALKLLLPDLKAAAETIMKRNPLIERT